VSAVTAAEGSPPGGLARIAKPVSPVTGTGSAATRSMRASGGASAGRRARKRSTDLVSASTSTTTPRASLSTCPLHPSSEASRYT
jgi:hypothetical protein